MKKVTTLVAAAAVALAFTACNKANQEVAPEVTTGNTYAGVTVRINSGAAGTRAVTDAQALINGVGGEDLVKEDGGRVFFKGQGVKNVKLSKVGNEESRTYKSAPFTANAGEQTLTLLLNAPEGLSLLPSDYTAEKKVELALLPKLTAETGFTQTGTTAHTVNVNEGIKEKQVAAHDTENLAENVFNLGNVERVISKGQIYRANEFQSGEELKKYGSVGTDFTWSLEGSAKEVYLFADKAGASNQMNEETQLYDGLTTAVSSLAVGASLEDADQVLQRVSDTYTDEALTNNFAAKALEVGTAEHASAEAAKSVFFLENACPTHAATAGEVYPFKRFTHFNVYASLIPNGGLKLEGDKLVAAATEDYAERTYDVTITVETYNTLTTTGDKFGKVWSADLFTEVTEPSPTEDDPNATKLVGYKYSVTDKANTFYIGSDNQLYRGLDAVLKAGLTECRKYDGGKMIYKTPANRQKNDQGVTFNADTRRNNIYQVLVQGFNNIGWNFNQTDPEDPNIPVPGDNPFEPTPNPDIEIDETENYMAVLCTTLKWNHVSRSEVLK